MEAIVGIDDEENGIEMRETAAIETEAEQPLTAHTDYALWIYCCSAQQHCRSTIYYCASLISIRPSTPPCLAQTLKNSCLLGLYMLIYIEIAETIYPVTAALSDKECILTVETFLNSLKQNLLFALPAAMVGFMAGAMFSLYESARNNIHNILIKTTPFLFILCVLEAIVVDRLVTAGIDIVPKGICDESNNPIVSF